MITNTQTKDVHKTQNSPSRSKNQNLQQVSTHEDYRGNVLRGSYNPAILSPSDRFRLQRTIGNQAIRRLSMNGNHLGSTVQRQSRSHNGQNAAVQVTTAGMGEEFQEYLTDMGRLYIQGVMADVHPGLLRRLGGALALAGHDANWIRIKQDAVLGFIDMRRSYDEIQGIARSQWQEHRRQIEAAIAEGISPAQAVEQYVLSRTGTYPHSPQQVEQMLQLQMGQAGTYSAWLYDIVEFRRRLQRGLDTLTGDTFTSIAAGMYFFATAEDWQNGTPEEWDRAFNFGEAMAPVAGLVEAAAGVQQGRTAPHPTSTATGPRIVVTDRGTGGTSSHNTGTQTRNRGSSTRGVPAHTEQPTQRPPAQATTPTNVDELNVEGAFREGAPFQRGPMQGIDRQGRRLIDLGRRSGQPQSDDLDFASERQRRNPSRAIAPLSSLNLNQAQVRAARRIIGRRLDGRWLRLWQQANNTRTRNDMQRVRQLERNRNLAEARELARQVYDRHREHFWNLVREDGQMKAMLEAAGFTVPSQGVPYYSLPDGRREYLTLEHSGRIHDTPSNAVNGNQLLFSLGRENSGMLEGLRETPYTQGEAAAR